VVQVEYQKSNIKYQISKIKIQVDSKIENPHLDPPPSERGRKPEFAFLDGLDYIIY